MRKSLPKPDKNQPFLNTFMSGEASPKEPSAKRKQRSGDPPQNPPAKKSTLSKSPNTLKKTTTQSKPPNKKVKSTKKMNEGNSGEPVNTDNNMEKELAAMETRMMENLTKNLKNVISEEMKEIKDTNAQMDTNMNSAITNMNQAVTRLIESNQAFLEQKNTIDVLQTENKILSTRVHRLENEQSRLKSKISQIENKTLECNIIIKGIPETIGETEQDLINAVHWEVSNTIIGNSERNRYEQARKMEIRKCKRIGKFNQDRSRPLSVEFLSRQDCTYILTNRSWLREGVYVEQEYSLETERKRKLLRPIVRASKYITGLKGKVHLKDDTVVVRGKPFTTKTLHKLPEELNVFNISSSSNDTTIGFFGELNPLSNFHPASFIFKDTHYSSSEQLIQHQKALYFGDHQTATRIITSETPADCKALGSDVENFNKDRWDSVAKEVCKPGIRQKFKQLTALMDVLINCTQHKKIVECASDSVWGTGVPLGKPDCLNTSSWINENGGILGEILTEIRDEEISLRRQTEQKNPSEALASNMETT